MAKLLSKNKNVKVAIAIPAYNEEKRIGKTLENYCNFFRDKKKSKEIKSFELIVVLNGCKDNTINVVKSFQKKYREIRYLDFKQAGKGFAIIQGFKDALKRDNDFIGFVDADYATAADAYYDLIKNLKNSRYDGVIASRGLKKSVVKTSFMRKLTNKGFNFIVRMLLFLPYKDTQCGAKLFKRYILENFSLEITEWSFDVDLLYQLRKRGFKVREVPTVWQDVSGSKLELVITPFKMFASVLRLRLIYSPFGFIVRAYDKLPEKIKIHSW